METITARIPEDQKKMLEKIGEEENLSQSDVLRRVIEQGTDEWRRERALELLGDNSITLRQASKLAGVSYVEMVDLASDKGVETGYTETELEKDLEWLE